VARAVRCDYWIKGSSIQGKKNEYGRKDYLLIFSEPVKERAQQLS